MQKIKAKGQRVQTGEIGHYQVRVLMVSYKSYHLTHDPIRAWQINRINRINNTNRINNGLIEICKLGSGLIWINTDYYRLLKINMDYYGLITRGKGSINPY